MDDAKNRLERSERGASCDELILELRKEGSSRSPEAVAASVPGDPWGIDVGLGHLLMRAADEIERLRADLRNLERLRVEWWNAPADSDRDTIFNDQAQAITRRSRS